MPLIEAGPVAIEYESEGDGPPVVLVMGIGAQLIHWPAPFCRMLADHGLRVIRFDNRDAGLSSALEGRPSLVGNLIRAALGRPIDAPYTLSDMAGDVVGLLDGLGLEDAHIVGMSMGGMIAQTTVLEHPDRVRSLTSISSTTGSRRFLGRWRAYRSLFGRARTRDEAIERTLRIFRTIGSPGFPFDEEAFRVMAVAAYERSFRPAGFLRQLAAILAAGSRGHALRSVATPTLVLHGSGDPLIPVAAGQATADAIPGARLRVIEGWGHDLPEPLWSSLADEIAGHVLAAEERLAFIRTGC